MANESSDALARVELPFPNQTPRHLRISIGPGKLVLRPGNPEPWVAGGAIESDSALTKVQVAGGRATINQTGSHFRLRRGLVPNLDLALGTALPYELSLEGGANDIICDLGGLPLEDLAGEFGAGRIRIDASAPNPVAMRKLAISTGATNLTLSNLANFNAEEIVIDGGAAAFRIDFGGRLQRDCSAKITTGVASVEITLPRDIAAKINASTTLGSLSVGDGFMTRDGGYWTKGAMVGTGPVLTLEATSSLGSLKVLLED